MPETFSDLTSVEFQSQLAGLNDGIVIDVRSEQEFRFKRIPGAINIDIMHRSFIDKINQLDKTKVYFVYCQSGVRSRQACILMAARGFNVRNLRDGINQWKGATCE